MNQLLSREEVAALLQGVAEAQSKPEKPGRARKPKAPEVSYQTRSNRKERRWYLAGSPR